MVEKIPTEIINMILFTNEIFSDNTTVKHERNRHRKDKTTTHRELRWNS